MLAALPPGHYVLRLHTGHGPGGAVLTVAAGAEDVVLEVLEDLR